MKKLILILILLNCTFGYSQQEDETIAHLKVDTTLKLENSILTEPIYSISLEMPECPFTIEKAKKDIEFDCMKIVIHTGFTGLGEFDKKRRDEFQKKYNVQFEYLGCMRFWDTANEDTDGYNAVIFEKLESVYGKSVSKEFNKIWN